ncbi:MAG: ATP-binding protein [Clostridia bacterium]|nr:ATP-binding protein [Clostridia bacterium]
MIIRKGFLMEGRRFAYKKSKASSWNRFEWLRRMFLGTVRRWNNINISKKIFIQFFATVLVFFIIISLVLGITGNTYSSIIQYNEFSENVTKNIIGIISSLNTMEFLTINITKNRDPRQILEIYIEISEREKAILTDLYILENTFVGDSDKVVQLRESILALQDIYNQIKNDLLSGNFEGMNIRQDQAGNMLNIVNRQIQDLLLISESMDNAIFLDAERDYQRQRLYLLITGMSAVFFMTLFVYLVGRGIYLPLEKFADELGKARDSSYKPDLDINRRDEIGYLSSEFIQMLEFVRNSNKKILNLEAIARNNQKMESLGVMASGIAHEINNPINGILGYSQLIKDMSKEGSDEYQYSGEIIREVNRVSYIIQNLLHFSRQKYSSRSRVNIVDIIERSLSLVRFLIRKDKIEITTDISADVPAVLCSEQEIEQVLINLLMNSRYALNEKFGSNSDDKKISITGSMFMKDDTKWLNLEIYDNGSGIPDEFKGLIFDPFFTMKEKNEGTGLGLSISYGIIKKHNGEIYFESRENEFTRFTIELPADGTGGGNHDENNF